MMYVLKAIHLELCVLRVSIDVLDLPGVVVADGNAAGTWTRFHPSPEGLRAVDRTLAFADWWNGSDEAKRVRCAEVLVPDKVPPSYLLGAYVSCETARRRLVALHLTEPCDQAIIHEHMFYR